MTATSDTIDVLGAGVVVPVTFPANLRQLFPAFAGMPVASLLPAEPANVVSALTAVAVEHTPLLGIHAGVVSVAGGALAIPGVSGLGKSTLTAALVREGFGYITDEVLAVDRHTLQYTAFPRPITVDANSRSVLEIRREDEEDLIDEVAIDPRLLGMLGPAHGKVTAILLAQRVATAQTSLRRETTTADAAVALLSACFNHYRQPAETLRAVASLVRDAAVFRITYSDATDAAARIAAHFRGD